MMVEERTRQLRETHEKLLHQDKMASLGKLSASVVHEINNPIAGILNLTMLIKRILQEDATAFDGIDKLNQFLDLMETETLRISRIVSNLLIFSRQSKIELKAMDINQILKKTLLLNSNQLRINNIKVKEKLSPNLPGVIGSEDQLQQVFMNIISNAAEAMAGDVEYIVNNSDSVFAFAKDQEQVDKFLESKEKLPQVRRVVFWDDKGMFSYRDNPWLMEVRELKAMGEAYEQEHPGYFEE